MKSIRRSAAIALAGISVLGVVAAPLATRADAATNTVTLRAIGSSELLTDVSSIGFVTMKSASTTRLDQKWTRTDVGGPGGFVTYRNNMTNECLEGNLSNPFFLRTKACNGSFAQQWNRGFVGDGRIENRMSPRVLTANFANINHAVEFRPFLGSAGQRWSVRVIG